jgi:lipoprotein signal peptidase
VAEQAAGTVEGTGSDTGAPVAYDTAHLAHNPGRPVSWVGTITVIIGFVIGGVAFPFFNPAPNWILFWIGTAVAIVGCLVLAFSKAMNTDWY